MNKIFVALLLLFSSANLRAQSTDVGADVNAALRRYSIRYQLYPKSDSAFIAGLRAGTVSVPGSNSGTVAANVPTVLSAFGNDAGFITRTFAITDTTAASFGVSLGIHPVTMRLGQKRFGAGQVFKTFAFSEDLNPIYASLVYKVTDVNGVTPLAGGALSLSTTNVPEGNNLYWTTNRFNTAGDARYTTPVAVRASIRDSLLSIYSALNNKVVKVNNVAPASGGLLTLNSGQIPEGTNLYWTATRFNDAGDARYSTPAIVRAIVKDSLANNTIYFGSGFAGLGTQASPFTTTSTGSSSGTVTVDNTVTSTSTNPPTSAAVFAYVNSLIGPLQTTVASQGANIATNTTNVANNANSITTINNKITNLTFADIAGLQSQLTSLQNQINALNGAVTPVAPTNAVVNDASNTFGWTNNSSYTSLTDYEYTLDGGGTYTVASANPINVGDVNKAVGSVGVRIKAASGRNASTTLYNATTFTASAVQLASPTVTVGSSTTSTIALSWSAPSNASGYILHQSQVSDFASYTTAYAGAATSYTATGLTSSTSYYYRVQATGGAGYSTSNYSAVATGTTSQTLAAYSAERTFRLSFQNSGTGAATTGWNQIKPATSALYADNSFTSQNLVTDAGGASTVTLSVVNHYDFSSASSLTATTGSVYPQTVMQSSWQVNSSNANGGSYTINGLTAGKYYQFYLLSASNATGVVQYVINGVAKTKTQTSNAGVGGGSEFDPNTALVTYYNIQADANGKITVQNKYFSGSSSAFTSVVIQESSVPKP